MADYYLTFSRLWADYLGGSPMKLVEVTCRCFFTGIFSSRESLTDTPSRRETDPSSRAKLRSNVPTPGNVLWI